MAKISRKLDRAAWAKLAPEMQGLYTEKSGQYVLDADDAEELANALKAQKDEVKELRDKLKTVEGIDPAKYKQLEEDAAKATRQRDLDERNFQKILDEDRAKHEGELKKRDDHAARLLGELEAERIDGELTRAAAQYKGASIDLILPAAKPFVKLREIGGKMRAVVLNDKGEPRLKPDAKTADDYMGPGELVAEMRNDKRYAAAFPANSPRQETQRLIPLAPGSSNSERDMVNKVMEQVKAGATKLAQ